MSGSKLFEDLPEASRPQERSSSGGRPRLREPLRDQIELRAVDLDSVIGVDHPVRLIWAYVQGLDLSELDKAVRSREGGPGHPAISPRLVVALWLFATSQGVGSARALARLCDSEDAYRWLCGGVSVNYHTLADARVGLGSILDRLLIENVAALLAAGLINLETLAQDGVKVRAAAGAKSFRRGSRLAVRLKQAEDVVQALKQEVHDDPAASTARIAAARARADRQRRERLAAAKAEHDRLTRGKEPPARRDPPGPSAGGEEEKPSNETRVSTTDPQARVMKMADGGFRPAYNAQVVSVAGSQIVLWVDPVTTGSDRGLIRPALEAVKQAYGRLPRRHLADGGFMASKDIEWAHAEGTALYVPPTKSKHGTDPHMPRRDDGPGVLAWRARMASEESKPVYAERAVCECIHARWRNWNLARFNVRGLTKVRAVMLWQALANNVFQAARMRAAAAVA
jgi:transposase